MVDFGPKYKVIPYYKSIDEVQLNKNKQILNKEAQILVKNYNWTKDLGIVATNLIYYFAGIEYEYSLDKSIALIGLHGIGKSKLMEIFQRYLRTISGGFGHPNIFRIISIEDVICAMQKDDFINCDLLYNNRTDLDRPVKKPANLLINEFGYKYNGKSYGTDYQELIEMFLMKRYDVFQEYGKLTHVTMNYDTNDLKQIFSPKLIDRFREMFNMVSINGTSFRQ